MPLDGGTVEAFLAAGMACLAQVGSVDDRERQRSSYRAQPAAERSRGQRSAFPVRRSSPSQESVEARLKLEGRRQPHFHPRRGRREAFEARESSGSEGARTVGRLQKSVRGIFPASLTAPARAAETALGSTDRRLLVTVEHVRFGPQGCRVNERRSEPPA